MKRITKTGFFVFVIFLVAATSIFTLQNNKVATKQVTNLVKAIIPQNNLAKIAPVTSSPAIIGASVKKNLRTKSIEAVEEDKDDDKEHEHGRLHGKYSHEDPDAKGGYDKKALVEGAFKLEFKKTKDLKTNTIPKYRLIEAAKYADNLKAALPRRSGTQGSQGALGSFTWVERGPNNIGGRTRAILTDLNDATGNTIWAGSVGGGLWKTTNALKAAPNNPLWQPVNDNFQNLAISCITQNPQNPKLIYFGTGEGWYNGDAIAGDGIWKTADGGNSWNQVASTGDSISNNTFYHVQKVLDYTVNGTEYLFACTRGDGVQVSKNGGLTWKQALGPSVDTTVFVYSAADIVRAADGALYAALGIFQTGGIYKSQDNGTSWVKLTRGLPINGYGRIVLGCAPSDSLCVYALIQDSATYSCKGIYRSDSAGRVWHAVTNPAIYNESNFAGQQAWYALALGVDPINKGHIIVGGLDLTASLDSGKTWNTISQWYGGGGFQYVHADHHAIVFDPRFPNNIYFGNDGGVFATTNGTSKIPVINQIDSSYNVTQFYHAAISPIPNLDYMIAGAQDNGNIQFTQTGQSPGVDFTGGDGAYVHIDDNNPNLQIAAYVYGNYYVSKDGFTLTDTSITVGNGNTGQFINPTDYDSRDKTLYAADNTGKYHIIKGVGTTDSTRIISMSKFKGQVSAVAVSPNIRKRVFFGLDNGTLFKVDNANASNPVATKIDGAALPSFAYLSCIAVEPGNDNHLLVCFSNYGLQGQSIWETNNGGTSWTSIAGNLPDMPIRSICFKPFSNSSAVIGTELGVWSTDSLKGSNTVWGESNAGLARVSTYWVDYRKSDGTLFAATHGRGLFTSASFNKPVISYVKADTMVNRSDAFTQGASCKPYYADIAIPVQLSSIPSAAAQVKVVVSSPSLVSGVDYDLVTTGNISFNAAGKQFVSVRLYNSPGPQAYDTIYLSLSLVNSNATNAIITPFPSFNKFALVVNNLSPVNLPIQTAVDTLTPSSEAIEPNRTAYFYDGSPAKHLIASIKNNSSTMALGCIKIAVDRLGNGLNVPFNVANPANYLASKTFRMVYGTNIASGLDYTLTLYYASDEVANWVEQSFQTSAALKIIGVKNHLVSDVTPSHPLASSVFIKATSIAPYNTSNVAFAAHFTSIDSLDGFGIGDSAVSTLPISLVSFQGKLDEGNTLLTWKTASETNNKGFEVQRSTNGHAFSQIGFVNGNGTTNLESSYTFTDLAVPNGVVYYRLKQIDLDGKYGFSNTIVVSKGLAAEGVTVAENPVHSEINLVFKGNISGTAMINVFDMAGKKLYSATKNVQSTLPLNIGNIGGGVYLVKVLWNEKTYTIKVVKN